MEEVKAVREQALGTQGEQVKEKKRENWQGVMNWNYARKDVTSKMKEDTNVNRQAGRLGGGGSP